ncbi:MAG: nicotinate (nicotinamide) nucleotide adenylyltransferase [Rhodocyclaceae bacterium]|nr:nicotinate (nicotinamide) nucleotide adenylyltransferase [Rhodocyclaceae bacterium]
MPLTSTSSNNIPVGALGLFGGTFDPLHTAHLKLAEEAMRQLRLSGILWIPAGCPPHRPPPVASATDRLAMVRLGLADHVYHSDWQVDDSEVMSSEPSYTIHTLERLRLVEKRPLVLLMGADAFLGLTTWYRWQDILRLAHIAVASRPGSDWTAHVAPHTPFIISAGTVSSTTVRTALQQGNPPDIPSSVLDYIRIHRLYGCLDVMYIRCGHEVHMVRSEAGFQQQKAWD